MAGLTPSGFETKAVGDILDDLEAEQRAQISPSLNLSTTSVLGQLNGIFAAALAELWQLAQSVYSAFDPNASQGASLAALATLTGTVKRPATKSTVTATVNLDGLTTLPMGSVASVSGNPAARFLTLAAVSNLGGVPANFSVAMEAETAGPVVALAGTLTIIAEPVTGWNSVTNALDAVEGKAEETDEELRLRREVELRAAGATTTGAIRSDLLRDVPFVTAVQVYENDTDYTNVDGVPPHSFEAVVRGPDVPTAADNQAVANEIFQSKAAGIQSYGTTIKIVEDSQGFEHTIKFTRPTIRNVWLTFNVTVDDTIYPVDGDAQIKQAVADFGDETYKGGDDVILAALCVPVFSVPGVLDIVITNAGFAPAPVGTVNLAIGVREVADLDTSRIVVNS